jgi:hypothetical protein
MFIIVAERKICPILRRQSRMDTPAQVVTRENPRSVEMRTARQFAFGMILFAVCIHAHAATGPGATAPLPGPDKLTGSDALNGLYFGMADLGGTPSFLMGQIDFAWRMPNERQFRVGFGFSGNADSASFQFAVSALADYLFFLVRGPVQPYVGLGTSLGFSAGSEPFTALDLSVYCPFGIEVPLTHFLSVGIEGKFSLSTTVEDWPPDNLAWSFSSPVVSASVWF